MGDDESTVAVIDRSTGTLWAIALLFFGAGDLLTTGIGLASGSAAEVGPFVLHLIEQYGLAAMPPMKAVAFLCCYGLWRVTPRPQAVGVPLGLAVLGVLVTAWNTLILSLAMLG